PATAALAWSPEWANCKNVNDKAEVERAIAACTHILEDRSERPNHAMALRNRCAIKDTAGDYEGALVDCDRAIALEPAATIGYERRGNVLRDKGESTRAMSDYDEAIRRDPQNAWALYARGALKRHIGDRAGGDRDVARAKQIKPDIGQ